MYAATQTSKNVGESSADGVRVHSHEVDSTQQYKHKLEHMQ